MNEPANKIASPAEAGAANKTALLPLLEPSDYTQFLIRNKNEILYILRSLLADSDHISVYFNEGSDVFLTMLIGLDDDELVLDFGSNPEINQRALQVNRLFCVANHERVRVQFLVRGLKTISFEGRPAFRAEIPDSLLRLQRREYYRLTTPIARPLRCQIPVANSDRPGTSIIEVNVIDISGGGLAVVAPPTGIKFLPEMKFPNCRIELPEVGVLVATLQVRSLFEVTLRSGTQVARAGCQFLNLPGPMLTLVQRYIIKVERERKARETGMA